MILTPAFLHQALLDVAQVAEKVADTAAPVPAELRDVKPLIVQFHSVIADTRTVE